MSDSLAELERMLPAASEETIRKVRRIEDCIRQYAQIEFCTEHVFQAGMYARTVRIPPGIVFTSVLVKVPTLLILNGCCDVLAGDGWVRMNGYNVIAAQAGRKQIYVTRSAVEVTMIFATDAKTVEEAESQFTEEVDILLSHSNENDIVVGTEEPCRESQPQLHS